MRVLVGLGLRLARAGGVVRAASIIAGNAVGVLVLLIAVALPAAAFPARQTADPDQRSTLVGVVVALVVPVAILLLTVGRLSSAVRDRRLASLRVVGLSRTQTQTVAAVENTTLALAGAVLGWVTFVLLAPVLDRMVAAGPDWFAAPLTTSVATGVATVVGVAILSALVSMAPVRTLAHGRAARSESARRRPSAWRLVVLAIAVAALAVAAYADPATHRVLQERALVVGAVTGALAIAWCTPVLTSWGAGLLTRSRSMSALLAGRAIQVEPAGASRLVAGIGVATFLVAASAGVLAAFESTPQFRYADQTLHDGPQVIHAYATTPDSVIITASAAQGAALAAVPGVDGVIDEIGAEACSADGCTSAFVGTCAQLALKMTVTGCRDDAAAVIAPLHPDDTDGENPIVGRSVIKVTAADASVEGIPLSDRTIVEDLRASEDEWVYTDIYGAFVPAALAPGLFGSGHSLAVIARGGTDVQDAVKAAGAAVGLDVEPYPTDDVDQVMQVRAIVWTLSAVIIGIGLLTVGLGTVDRALERRRAVARQVAVGVPARVLRGGQLLQTLLPLVVSVALATGCGWLLVRGYLRYGELASGALASRLGIPLVATVLGAAVVSLATLPLIRTRLDARLLRTE